MFLFLHCKGNCFFISSIKNAVKVVDKMMSIALTGSNTTGFIVETVYLMDMIQCSKSFALPLFPVNFLYNLLFNLDV